MIYLNEKISKLIFERLYKLCDNKTFLLALNKLSYDYSLNYYCGFNIPNLENFFNDLNELNKIKKYENPFLIYFFKDADINSLLKLTEIHGIWDGISIYNRYNVKKYRKSFNNIVIKIIKNAHNYEQLWVCRLLPNLSGFYFIKNEIIKQIPSSMLYDYISVINFDIIDDFSLKRIQDSLPYFYNDIVYGKYFTYRLTRNSLEKLKPGYKIKINYDRILFPQFKLAGYEY